MTNQEFERLRAHRFENRHLQETADVFIILCRCGFYYGDLLDLVQQYTTAIRQGIDGKLWLVKDRIKTEVKTVVPVFEEVDQIVGKYGGWEKLPLKPLPKFNHWLKMVAAELGLYEELSSKAGRRRLPTGASIRCC